MDLRYFNDCLVFHLGVQMSFLIFLRTFSSPSFSSPVFFFTLSFLGILGLSLSLSLSLLDVFSRDFLSGLRDNGARFLGNDIDMDTCGRGSSSAVVERMIAPSLSRGFCSFFRAFSGPVVLWSCGPFPFFFLFHPPAALLLSSLPSRAHELLLFLPFFLL